MSNFNLKKYLIEGRLYKEEMENIPQYLYHATYKPLLKKIKETGSSVNIESEKFILSLLEYENFSFFSSVIILE